MQTKLKPVAALPQRMAEPEVSLDEYFAIILQTAADRFPNAGIMLLIVNDAKEGELTSLSNMGDDETAYVLELAQAGHDSEEPLCPVSLTRH